MTKPKSKIPLAELMKDPNVFSTTNDIPRRPKPQPMTQQAPISERPNYEGMSTEELEAMLDGYKNPKPAATATKPPAPKGVPPRAPPVREAPIAMEKGAKDQKRVSRYNSQNRAPPKQAQPVQKPIPSAAQRR
jgi:hypothetical protein